MWDLNKPHLPLTFMFSFRKPNRKLRGDEWEVTCLSAFLHPQVAQADDHGSFCCCAVKNRRDIEELWVC